jgi:hypothetical protein
MNTFVKLAAPALLAFAAFGAQASQLSPGDFGLRAVSAGADTVAPIAGPVAPASQLATGDFGTRAVQPGTAPGRTAGERAAPIRMSSTTFIGA